MLFSVLKSPTLSGQCFQLFGFPQLLGSYDGVLHQHGNRHGPNSAGDRRDVAGFLLHPCGKERRSLACKSRAATLIKLPGQNEAVTSLTSLKFLRDCQLRNSTSSRWTFSPWHPGQDGAHPSLAIPATEQAELQSPRWGKS